VHGFADDLRKKGVRAREFVAKDSPETLRESLPIRVGPGANRGIILRGDTFLELGNPSAGSCSHLLWTNDENLVHDGRITLLGPDIPEARGVDLPFGQMLLIEGAKLGPDHHEKLHQAQLIGDQIEGYMVRSSSEQLWSRVSKQAYEKGLCFEVLGKAIVTLIKSQVPEASGVEIVFFTSSKQDIKQLQNMTLQVKDLGSEILKETWKARGFDLECDFDCSSCHSKEVCDDIRDVIVATQTKRETSEISFIKNS